ncbi:hypothetical protein HG531_000775 [Fusarium graminearum]|nr:hypothetical protein HG531_000775 [Fusarium graminearum]
MGLTHRETRLPLCFHLLEMLDSVRVALVVILPDAIGTDLLKSKANEGAKQHKNVLADKNSYWKSGPASECTADRIAAEEVDDGSGADTAEPESRDLAGNSQRDDFVPQPVCVEMEWLMYEFLANAGKSSDEDAFKFGNHVTAKRNVYKRCKENG